MDRVLCVLGVSLSLVLVGCLDLGEEVTSSEDETSVEWVEHSAVPPTFEKITLYDRDLVFAPDSPGGTGIDPCNCTTDQCIQDWAGENFGCNVCVVVLCDGAAGPHVCTSCP